MTTILFFGWAKELTGNSSAQIELSEFQKLPDVWRLLLEQFPALAPHSNSCKLAVNRVYANAETVIRDGDEVAVIPPVSGG
jgi:molybdopterin synthase catalytic subunit